MNLRQCPKCFVEKKFPDEFPPDIHRPIGTRPECRACYNSRKKELHRINLLKKKGLYHGEYSQLFESNREKLNWAYKRFRVTRDPFRLRAQLIGALEPIEEGILFYTFEDRVYMKMWLPDGIRTYGLATTKVSELAKILAESHVKILIPEELDIEAVLRKEKENDRRENG